LDFLVNLVTLGWVKAFTKPASPKLKSVPVDDDESHRVKQGFRGHHMNTEGLARETLYSISHYAFQHFPKSVCMRKRQFLGWKTKKIKEFGKEVSWTYEEIEEKALKFGAALIASGMQAAPPTTDLEMIKTPCRMAIFENTCPEWMIAALGAFSQSVAVATVYTTLGIDSVAEAINDNIIPVILCNKRNVKKLIERSSKMPTLKVIVYTEDLVAPGDDVEMPTTIPSGVKVISFDDFCQSGNTAKYKPVPPKPDTTAVIMYTSGSTGKPKGVVITHRNVAASVTSVDLALQIRKGEDSLMAHLPLAHIFEMIVEFLILSKGCTLCYADPKSLSLTGASPTGALEYFSPTIVTGVPKIWDAIKKGIEAKVAKGTPVAQFLVKTAFEARASALARGYDTPLFKALVFKKFQQAVGGNARICLSGGGPLNGSVQEFLRVCLGCSIIQGYGLTETTAGLTIQAQDDPQDRIAGVPMGSVEIKVVSTPDICDKAGNPYLSTDRVDVEGNPVFGRGEIVARGNNITSGYYMMPEITKEVFVDGWFYTGDVGQFMEDGSIRIVDRKKNLVKLKGGEYIAVEKMEMTYGNSKFVDASAGGICCYGDGDMGRPVALMQPKEDHTMTWAAQTGVKGSFEEIMESSLLYDAIMDDMMAEHKKSDLSHLEKLVSIKLLNIPWTPENGCLTAANKLQRRCVIQMFEKEFNELKPKGIF